jgi:hypothetical protein
MRLLPDQQEVCGIVNYDAATGIFSSRRTGQVLSAKNSKGYLQISIRNRTYYAHRLAWLYVHGTWPVHQVDHINGNRTDNRICNLRLATPSENQCNMGVKKHSQVGIKGVAKVNNRYRAVIRKNCVRYHLGYFSTPEAASAAYSAAAARLHGDFAFVNDRDRGLVEKGCD